MWKTDGKKPNGKAGIFDRVYGDELLTDKEVAYLLKVSRRTLLDYRNNGILPYTQVGGKILYRTSDIERILMNGYKEAYRCSESG